MIPLRWKLGAVGALIVVAAAVAWFTDQINDAERRGAVRATADSVQARADRVLADSSRVWQERDTALVALNDSLARAAVAAGRKAAQDRIARQRADSAARDALARLEAGGADTADVALVLADLRATQAEAESCGIALGTCEGRLEAQRRLFAADSTRWEGRQTELQETIRDLQATVRLYEEAGPRGADIPWIAVAGAAGVVAGVVIVLLAGGG